MFNIEGKVNTAVCFASVVEDCAIQQIKRMCDYDFTAGSQIRIMPDVHAGKGCTIGTTMTVRDKVVPNIVGVDIGCGMYTINLGKMEIDLERLDKAAHFIPSGMRARFPSASFTWKYSPKTPSLKFENFQPASIPPECIEYPPCASREFQSGVMAGTRTLSPGLKSFTKEPTSTTSPQPSCPKIMSCLSPIAPSQTVCTSDVHGASASGLQIASSGPQAGISFSIQPVSPSFSIA